MLRFALVASVLLAGSCYNASDRCGMKTELGACVSLTNIVPMYNTTPTDSVDVVADQCLVKRGNADAGVEDEYEPEYFADHSAQVTIQNKPPVELNTMPDRGAAITIGSYVVDFVHNGECLGTCPDLTPLVFDGPSFTIPSGGEHTFTLPLVPLRTKKEFSDEGGTADDFTSYTARYRMLGHDNKGDFEITGDVEFTLGHFDYCKFTSGA